MNKAGDTTAAVEARAWAADVLGVAVDAPQSAVTAALLTRVRDDDFAPRPDVAVAFDVLIGCASVDGEEKRVWQAGVESRLRADIERFTQSFFDLPSKDRKTAWESLLQRAETWPSLRRRLMRLERGLPLSAPEPDWLQQPHVADLVLLIRSCYLATPPEAARLRRAKGPEIQEDRVGWLQAAHTLQALRPDFARLGADILDWVVGGAANYVDSHLAPRIFSKARQQPSPTPRATPIFDDLEFIDATAKEVRDRRDRRAEQDVRPPSETNPSPSGWWVIVAIFLGIIMLRGVTALARRWDEVQSRRPSSAQQSSRGRSSPRGPSPDVPRAPPLTEPEEVKPPAEFESRLKESESILRGNRTLPADVRKPANDDSRLPNNLLPDRLLPDGAEGHSERSGDRGGADDE
jgi:hypothetical protein